MSTKGIQNIYFECPTCHERFAQTEVWETDIHMGETCHCASCGGQIIFQALSMEQYSEMVKGPVDCCCVARQCEYEPTTLIDMPKGETR